MPQQARLFKSQFDVTLNHGTQTIQIPANHVHQARNATSRARPAGRFGDYSAGIYFHDKVIWSKSLHANLVTRSRQPSLAAVQCSICHCHRHGILVF